MTLLSSCTLIGGKSLAIQLYSLLHVLACSSMLAVGSEQQLAICSMQPSEDVDDCTLMWQQLQKSFGA